MPKPSSVTTRRIDTDEVLAIVPLDELADYLARHGLRSVRGYWPDYSAQPMLFVEPIPVSTEAPIPAKEKSA